MSLRRIAALLAVLLLLAGVCAASGTAGEAADPLLTQGYMDGTFTQSVLSDAEKAFDFTFGRLQEELTASPAGKKSTGSYTVRSVQAGSTASFGTGCCLMLLSGEASVTVRSGALVNVTAGAEAVSGRLLAYNRYLACEDCTAEVVFTADSAFAADGSVSVTGNVSPFSDVTPKDWFYGDVAAAVQRGLVDGITPTSYRPQGEMTGAQCVTLAARLHQLYRDGSVTLQNSESGPWYRSYADYALRQGILDADLADYDKAVDRLTFVRIFFRAMPESAYSAVNAVADNAIPDVKNGDAYAYEIYCFYRAGVLSGYTKSAQHEEYAFGPDNTITRAEVAAIMNRMVDPGARQIFTLG